MDDGEEKITDGGLVAALRSKARRVHVLSLLLAAVLTAVTLVGK
jgi:hypothetical protein